MLDSIAESGLVLHEAYTQYGSSRVSCAFCILGSQADLLASAGCKGNHDVYRELVGLEADSTFAFQGNHWLADVAPSLLPQALLDRVQDAKEKAVLRQRIEAELPDRLLFVKGRPTAIPTMEEAELIASVRSRLGTLMKIDVRHTTAQTVQRRYAELMEENRT